MNDNSPAAFPSSSILNYEGMSLRDYFAAKVLGAIEIHGRELDTDTDLDLELVASRAKRLAKLSYVLADAMIEARCE